MASPGLPEPSFTPAERIAATDAFRQIVQHFADNDDGPLQIPYSRPRLIRYTHEYALTQTARDNVLHAFFSALCLPFDGGSQPYSYDQLEPLFGRFADFLVDQFYLPLKAATSKTPKPTPPAPLRAAQGAQAAPCVGTPDRLASLRGQCLARDQHRCVISGSFDYPEYAKREKRDPGMARDDQGVLFSRQASNFSAIKIAHILPHGLINSSLPGGGVLDEKHQATLAILNMLDHGVAHLIEGAAIDRPCNALSLRHDLHAAFGRFEVYFDAIPGQDHAYRIQSFLLPAYATQLGLPVDCVLFRSENQRIDPPSPRLLAVHRAVAHILHRSAAGEYIDRVLDDMEDSAVHSDGSTELGRMVHLRMRGWTDGNVA